MRKNPIYIKVINRFTNDYSSILKEHKIEFVIGDKGVLKTEFVFHPNEKLNEMFLYFSLLKVYEDELLKIN